MKYKGNGVFYNVGLKTLYYVQLMDGLHFTPIMYVVLY